jgi:translation initiation factor IF-2
MAGKLKTFKHHKKDILEAQKGLECGICVEDFIDLMEGDVIQAISETSTKRFVG